MGRPRMKNVLVGFMHRLHFSKLILARVENRMTEPTAHLVVTCQFVDYRFIFILRDKTYSVNFSLQQTAFNKRV